MRIALLVSDFPPRGETLELKNGISLGVGGTEIQSYNLAKRLGKKHEVIVFTRRYNNLPLIEKRDGFLVKKFRIVKLPVLSFISHIISSAFLIRKNKPDILQCMMLTPNGLVGILVNRLFRIRSVPWIRGGDWYITRNNHLGRFITSLVIRKSPIVLVQTEKTKREVLREFPGKRIVVIPNAVELKQKRARGDKVVFVGNLIERKGVEYLIEAMRDLKAELLLVGDGPKRKRLESISGKNVKFTGRVRHEEVNTYLKRAKIFVLPAKEGEGLPNVILEAMSLGIPVVATDIAGISDVVKHGKTGFLVEPRNPRQLRKHIKMLLESDKLRREMSRNSLEEVKKYSWDKMLENLEKVYGEICAE
jgi:glycosyltransferase involved in cell wall biosynthesis